MVDDEAGDGGVDGDGEGDVGRRKTRERARKWREWAFIIRFDSVKTTQRLTVGGRGDGVAIESTWRTRSWKEL